MQPSRKSAGMPRVASYTALTIQSFTLDQHESPELASDSAITKLDSACCIGDYRVYQGRRLVPGLELCFALPVHRE